jgi:hypothetical protein
LQPARNKAAAEAARHAKIFEFMGRRREERASAVAEGVGRSGVVDSTATMVVSGSERFPAER